MTLWRWAALTATSSSWSRPRPRSRPVTPQCPVFTPVARGLAISLVWSLPAGKFNDLIEPSLEAYRIVGLHSLDRYCWVLYALFSSITVSDNLSKCPRFNFALGLGVGIWPTGCPKVPHHTDFKGFVQYGFRLIQNTFGKLHKIRVARDFWTPCIFSDPFYTCTWGVGNKRFLEIREWGGNGNLPAADSIEIPKHNHH